MAADAAITYLIDAVKENFVLEKDVNVKIKKIEDELLQLQSVHSDWGEGDETGVYIKREVRAIIYSFEDVRENFALVAASRVGFRRFVFTGLTDLRELATEIRDIERRIEFLNVDGQRFWKSSDKREEGSAFGTTYGGISSCEQFVGRVEEIKVLRSYLIDESHSVISIFGMGGLGKTVLAMKLSHDPHVRLHFEAVAWVSVGQRSQRSEILRDLYYQLDPHQKQKCCLSNEMDDAAYLAQRVYKIQQERRCLIILDDVWSSNAWQSLRIAFPSTETRSKILVTTRVMEVAEIVAAKRYIHKLRCLTNAEGCDLMKRLLLSHVTDIEVDRIISEVGKEVVKCCEGLPLAIIRFIQFTETERPQYNWEEVHRHFKHFVSKEQEILRILDSSYNTLPPFLKPCFLYLGYLQEHSQIEAERLYLFWVAEGLISQEDCGKEETPMQVAERYLNDLARRGMVEIDEEEVPTIIRFRHCLPNQFMRELSLRKCEEQHFFKRLYFVCGNCSTYPQNQAKRLSGNLDRYVYNEFPVNDKEKKEIWCLLLSSKENQQDLVWPKSLSGIEKFKYLRVLDFTHFSFQLTKLPQGIGKLIFLRYLSFKSCFVPELPSSIGNLRFLCILDLRVTNRMTIPDVLWRLKKLKHLYFPLSFGTRNDGKLRLDGLVELETVTNLNTTMFNVEHLLTSPNLHYISLSIPGSVDDIECIIKRLNVASDVFLLSASVEVTNFDCYTEERHQVFRQLLGCHSLTALSIEGYICRLPFHNEISPNLAKIVLNGSELMYDPMKALEKLPKLRVLVLEKDAFVGEKMMCSSMGFVELKRLELSSMQSLEKWIVDDRAMPKLSMLTIVNCGKLLMLPEELKFVRRLRQMNVSRMSKQFEDSVKIVDDMYKDQDGPSIIFQD